MERKAKILIVDDEIAACKALEELLRKEGYRTESVHSGKEAVEAVKQGRADVVLMDIHMPGMDGIEALWEMKRWSRDCSIILMTALSELEVAVSGDIKWIDGFLRKPVFLDELKQSIEKALGRKGGKADS